MNDYRRIQIWAIFGALFAVCSCGATSTGQGVDAARGGAAASAGAAGTAGTAGNGSTLCGNGVIDVGERCDDGNTNSGDGCNSACRFEKGWTCGLFEPTECTANCGDGLRVGPELTALGCDDGNSEPGDGCDLMCRIEPEFSCESEPSSCAKTCSNGKLDAGETCDDGNWQAGDGCGSTCQVEAGFACSAEPSNCAKTCGNGQLDAAEVCEDGNSDSFDGCSSTCQIEPGFVCTGLPSRCTRTCGNGRLDAGEACDDGNEAAHDGCFSCAFERGFNCDVSSSPSVCTDVDECATGKNNCNAQATCTNTEGSFICTCKDYQAGNGVRCTPQASCEGLPANCGSEGNDDCCASAIVPGGTFQRGNDAAYPATISSFALDKYEVSVGRYRKFVAAAAAQPGNGAGAHPLIPNSGWQTTWDSAQLSNPFSLDFCVVGLQTYDETGKNDRLPMNCVNWYQAFEFCLWDGGRLPTEAEWEYAATGGDSQFLYPWGNQPPNPDYAVYRCSTCDSTLLPAAVGSKPLGAGKYGHLDLAGSVNEWLLDYWSDKYPTPCNDCAVVRVTAAFRDARGGSWREDASLLSATHRAGLATGYVSANSGLRCARQPPKG
jgi:cysteine-rich repeat protein